MSLNITLQFFNPSKNNELWWNRLIDRLKTVKSRKWAVTGGVEYGNRVVTFLFDNVDGVTKLDQEDVNQIVWIFILEQINIDRFIIDGTDVTKTFTHR